MSPIPIKQGFTVFTRAEKLPMPGKQPLLLTLLHSVLIFVALCFIMAKDAHGAEQEPFLSLERGVNSESALLRPGKLDFLFKHRPEENQYNFFAWTPLFKGGAGIIDPDNPGPSSKYVGGFVRPLAAWRDKGDLILAAQGVEAGPREDCEIQGEYRFPFGLG